MNKTKFVPMKEACRLWMRDPRTLKEWALQKRIRSMAVPMGTKKKQSAWYIETPDEYYSRINNL